MSERKIVKSLSSLVPDTDIQLEDECADSTELRSIKQLLQLVLVGFNLVSARTLTNDEL